MAVWITAEAAQQSTGTARLDEWASGLLARAETSDSRPDVKRRVRAQMNFSGPPVMRGGVARGVFATDEKFNAAVDTRCLK